MRQRKAGAGLSANAHTCTHVQTLDIYLVVMTDVRYTNVCTHDGQHGRLIFTADKLQREKLHQERRLQ